jgi:N-acetylated-alpha-linked acidic dipeptidase
MNGQVLRFERAFVDSEGLPGRPWYRHVVYAPRFTYEPQTLPGLNDAIDARDPRRIGHQARRLESALRRAAIQLGGW